MSFFLLEKLNELIRWQNACHAIREVTGPANLKDPENKGISNTFKLHNYMISTNSKLFLWHIGKKDWDKNTNLAAIWTLKYQNHNS